VAAVLSLPTEIGIAKKAGPSETVRKLTAYAPSAL
jgi:hypothetical protein